MISDKDRKEHAAGYADFLRERSAATAAERAAAHEREAAASFERCDTDGFATQWAHTLSARKERLQQEIDDLGGRWEFRGLFDQSGIRIKAKLVSVEDLYGPGRVTKWLILDDEGNALHWVNRPVDPTNPGARSKMAQLGLHEEGEWAEAYALIPDNGQKGFGGMATLTVIAQRKDDGYPKDAQVLT